jgi:hypothetical protein
MEGERKRLTQWYAEALGILESVAADTRSILAPRAKACLHKKPFVDT